MRRVTKCALAPSVRAARHVAICAALAAAGAALADVDLGIGRGDSVKGTFDPAEEVESFRATIPRGAKVTAKITGSKGAKGHVTLATDGGDVLATGVASKPTSGTETLVHTTTASGAYVVAATSRDMTVGAYSLSMKWTTPPRPSGRESIDGGMQQVFVFGADDGATATITASAAPGSAALPRVLRIDGPAGFAATPGVGGTTPSVKVPATKLAGTGDYAVLIENASATAGEVDIRITLKTPKRKARKVDVTSAALGGSGTAVGAIVGAEGAIIEVGDLGLGGGPDDISGASISLPAGSVPAGTPIFIGSAPPLDPKGAPTPLGAAVSFGPDGQKFATPVTITIPASTAGVPEEDIAVFTRSGSGKVSQVEEPLTIDPVAGTVSFPASHFSDYVVVATRAQPSFSTLLTQVFDISPGGVPSRPGSLYVISDGNRVRTVTFSPGTGYQTSVYAGGGSQTADGTARLAFNFGTTTIGLRVHVAGSKVYVAADHAVYVVDDALGTVSRVFGTGVSGDSGDGGPGVAAQIRACWDLKAGPGGTILIVDPQSARIRTLSAGGDAGTLAGDGTSAPGPDGSDALLTSLHGPGAVATVLDGGDVYIAELGRLRRVNSLGAINTIAGDPLGQRGCVAPTSGARSGQFQQFGGVTTYFDTETNSTRLYVADRGCGAIWRIDPMLDEIELVAGTPGTPGTTPDAGGVGLLLFPLQMIEATESSFLFLESGNNRALRVYTKPQ